MYSKGQIVRIKCINVLTYDEVEITPCEKLNLVIGANGSGKSTLICAIILGLGGKPEVVGRASELQKYVKVGRHNASIEIELFNPEGNDIIERKYNTKNGSRFFLNGREISVERIHKLMRKYNIQIDNLCQILPQEKLEEFAKMNDHERLEGTIKTVGNQNLADWLTELKESKTKEVEVKKKLENLKEELAQTTRKRDNLGVEARTIKEKELLFESLKLLQQRRIWQFYYHLKETSVKVESSLANKKEVCKNMVILLRKCKANLSRLSQDVRGQNEQIGAANCKLLNLIKEVKQRQNEITVMTDKITDIKAEFQRQVKQFNTQEMDVKTLKETIVNLQKQISNVDELQTEIAETQKQIREQQDEVRRIADSRQEIEFQMNHQIQDLNALNNRLGKMNDVVNYKMKLLEHKYHDTYIGYQWINKNRHLFRGHVYGPLFLELTVNDINNAKYVENCIANRDLLAFMCEFAEDTDTLLEEFTDRQNLKVSVITAMKRDRRSLTPRLPIESLHKFGFHSYVADFIGGPDIIVTYFIATFNLHNIPVGNAHTSKLADKIPSDIRVFFTDKLRVSINIVALTKLPIQSSSDISEARLLKINVNRGDFDELEKQKGNLESQLRMVKEKFDALNMNVTVGDNALKELNERLRQLKLRYSAQGRVRETLKTKMRDLHHLQNNVVDINVQRNKCNLNVKLTLSQICNKFIELGEFFNQLNDSYVQLQIEKINKEQREKIYLKNLQITAEFVSQLKLEASSMRKLELKRRKIVKFVNVAHQWALKSTGGIDPTSQQFKKRRYFVKLNFNVIVLYRQISRLKAKIDCLGNSNQGLQIIKDYRRFAKDVERLKHKIEKKEEGFRSYAERIEVIKQKWIIEVECLITTINANFSRFFANMKCAGEVSFYKGETGDDYHKYGIHIRVKFREEGTLQILNAHTQSGGERAVSVAIYLLSLQELTSVPFRCIDEINQGMDADNERRIFNLLTKATEDQCNTQYFLLTPKLLPHLVFTSSMAILCPFNGIGSITHSKLPAHCSKVNISCSKQYIKSRSSSPQPSTSQGY